MKKIELEEQKKLLIEILKYFDNICRKNNLKYTLVGGSLIGAIRHKGIIPWDDDIDVGLLYENYKKLLDLLKREKNEIYEVQYFGCNSTYFYPFIKIVDKRTTLIELDKKPIKDYGVYLDIFCFNNFPNNSIIRRIHYMKIMFCKKLINLYSYNQNYINNQKKFVKKIGNIICSKIGFEFLNRKFQKISIKYNNNNNCKFCSLNWPYYGYDKEIFLLKDFAEFIDYDFEDMKAMIISSYDEILKTTFNDYMKLPPVEKRNTTHNIDIYWK